MKIFISGVVIVVIVAGGIYWWKRTAPERAARVTGEYVPAESVTPDISPEEASRVTGESTSTQEQIVVPLQTAEETAKPVQ